MCDNLLHLVYLRDGGMLLTKKAYSGWREIQDEHEGYMASLGPWPVPDVIDFLDEEYPGHRPVASRVHAFVQDDAETIEL